MINATEMHTRQAGFRKTLLRHTRPKPQPWKRLTDQQRAGEHVMEEKAVPLLTQAGSSNQTLGRSKEERILSR